MAICWNDNRSCAKWIFSLNTISWSLSVLQMSTGYKPLKLKWFPFLSLVYLCTFFAILTLLHPFRRMGFSSCFRRIWHSCSQLNCNFKKYDALQWLRPWQYSNTRNCTSLHCCGLGRVTWELELIHGYLLPTELSPALTEVNIQSASIIAHWWCFSRQRPPFEQ